MNKIKSAVLIALVSFVASVVAMANDHDTDIMYGQSVQDSTFDVNNMAPTASGTVKSTNQDIPNYLSGTVNDPMGANQ